MPKNEATRLWANQLQLTIADWLYEAGQTHHPIANVLYYEEQSAEGKKRGAHFASTRIPKFLATSKEFLRLTLNLVTFCSANGLRTSISRSSR